MIPLLLDMGLPRRAASDLLSAGWDVVHVGDIGMGRATDDEVLDRALAENRVVVTLDSDFARIMATSRAARPSVILVRLSGVDRARAVHLLERLVPQLLDDLAAGCIASITERGVRVRHLPVQ